MQPPPLSSRRFRRLPWILAGSAATLAVAGTLTLVDVEERWIAALLVTPPLALLAWCLRRLRLDWVQITDREIHLSTTLRSISDGVITTDAEGRVCTMNRVAEQFTGWPEAEARGLRLNQILQLTHRDTGEFLTNSFSRVLKSKTTVELPRNTIMLSRDGTERMIDSVGTPIRGDDGVCTGAVLVMRDITERSIAESALHASQAMFRQITDNVNDIITIHELDGRRLFTSRPGQGLVHSPEPPELPAFSAVAEKDRERIRAAFESVAQTGAAQRVEYLFHREDGATRLVESIGTLIRDSEQRPHRVLVVSRDVTERHESEARLRREVEFTESVLRGLPGIFFLSDAQNRVRRWNRNFELMTGWSSEEIPALNLLDFFVPSEHTTLTDRISNCFTAGKMDMEVHLRPKSGRLSAWYISGLRIESSEGPAMIGIGINISARKAAEEALLATNYRLERQNAALGEQARNPALRGDDLDATFRTVTEVACRTLGVSRTSLWFFSEDGESMRCADLFEHPQGSHSSGQELQASEHPRYFAALNEGRVIPAHYARNDPRTRDFTEGYLKPLGITSMLDAPIRSDGKLIGVICHEHTGSPREWSLDEQNFAGAIADLIVLSMEIAHRRQAERALTQARDELEIKVKERTQELSTANERLKELDRLKSEFLATMSHELRTPLNSIIGFTGILRQELAGPLNDEQKKQLGMVHFSAKHLLSLINDLLDLSQIESGRMPVRSEEFRVADVVAEVAQSLQPQVSQKKLSFSSTIDDPDLTMVSDRKKTFQVLLNLANNAVKFTERGSVTISVKSSSSEVEFAVDDSGIGIKPEQMANLFQAFRQIDGSARRVYEGTGLGLYLCKKLVTLLGGTIGVRSEFGSGSRFHFNVPRTLLKNS